MLLLLSLSSFTNNILCFYGLISSSLFSFGYLQTIPLSIFFLLNTIFSSTPSCRFFSITIDHLRFFNAFFLYIHSSSDSSSHPNETKKKNSNELLDFLLFNRLFSYLIEVKRKQLWLCFTCVYNKNKIIVEIENKYLHIVQF